MSGTYHPAILFVQLKEDGKALEANGRLEEALTKYEEIWRYCRSDFERAFVYDMRGTVNMKMGNFAKAIQLFSAATTHYPDFLEATLRRAQCFSKFGNYLKAMDCLVEVHVRLPAVKNPSPGYLEAITDMLRIQSRQLLNEYARSEIEKIQTSRTFPFPREMCIQHFFRRFYCDPVSRMWRGLDPMPQGDEATGFVAAITCLRSNRVSEVIDHCGAEIKNLKGRYVMEALLLRGSIYFLWGKGLKALADFQVIIDDPFASKKMKSCAHLKAAMVQDFWGFPEDTVAHYAKAAELWKENADVHYNRAVGLRFNAAAALDYLNKAVIECCPDRKQFPLLHAFRAFMEASVHSLLHGDRKRALEAVEVLKRMEEKGLFDIPDCYDAFGDTLSLLRHEAMMTYAFDKASELSGGCNLYQLKKIMGIFMNLDNSGREAALKQLEKFTEDEPDIAAFAHERICDCLIILGRFEEGLASMEKAIQLAPNIYDAKRRVQEKVEYEFAVKLAVALNAWEKAFAIKSFRKVV